MATVKNDMIMLVKCFSLKGKLLAGLFLLVTDVLSARENLDYKDMPWGKYAVGFEIITVIESNRVSKPEYNYWGEKNREDRRRKITIQLWYPAENNSGKRSIKYDGYCYNGLPAATIEVISETQKNKLINQWRNAMGRFFWENFG